MNQIPTTLRPTVAMGSRAYAAAKALGQLKSNDADTIGADLWDLDGRPADPTATPPVAEIIGKQPAYSEARALHTVARVLRRTAEKAGHDHWARAVDSLRGDLGRRWNSRWAAVGFDTGSLSIKGDPLPMLSRLAAHYRAHTEHELAVVNLTAARTEQVKQAIVAARLAADQAKMNEATAKQARDAAFERLRGRLTALRNELESLLSDDDSRWYGFGFRRPVDGKTPDFVETISLGSAAPPK